MPIKPKIDKAGNCVNLSNKNLAYIPNVFTKKIGKKLKVLDLSNNRLDHIMHLDLCIGLHTLNMDNNALCDHSKMIQLPQLVHLSINKNKIMNLSHFISAVQRNYPNLQYFSMLQNDACPNFFNGGTLKQYKDYRLFVISQLRKLHYLDSQAVSSEERAKAKEIYGSMVLKNALERPDVKIKLSSPSVIPRTRASPKTSVPTQSSSRSSSTTAPPPPPPPKTSIVQHVQPKNAEPKSVSSRGGMLADIRKFSKGNLKKAKTVDKSIPEHLRKQESVTKPNISPVIRKPAQKKPTVINPKDLPPLPEDAHTPPKSILKNIKTPPTEKKNVRFSKDLTSVRVFEDNSDSFDSDDEENEKALQNSKIRRPNQSPEMPPIPKDALSPVTPPIQRIEKEEQQQQQQASDDEENGEVEEKEEEDKNEEEEEDMTNPLMAAVIRRRQQLLESKQRRLENAKTANDKKIEEKKKPSTFAMPKLRSVSDRLKKSSDQDFKKEKTSDDIGSFKLLKPSAIRAREHAKTKEEPIHNSPEEPIDDEASSKNEKSLIDSTKNEKPLIDSTKKDESSTNNHKTDDTLQIKEEEDKKQAKKEEEPPMRLLKPSAIRAREKAALKSSKKNSSDEPIKDSNQEDNLIVEEQPTNSQEQPKNLNEDPSGSKKATIDIMRQHLIKKHSDDDSDDSDDSDESDLSDHDEF